MLLSTFFTRRRRHSRRGLTLVEVMISTLIFTLVALGALSSVIYSYRINDRTRYRDQGRAVLQGVAEDFLRGPLRSANGQQQPLFNNAANTGVGIEITSYDETQVYRADASGNLFYPLDTRGTTTINMQITRTVYNVNATNGGVNNGTVSMAETMNGRLKACRLVGTFTLHGRVESVELTVLRHDRFQ
jgi:prepilin-type N-terminal cleavage/methylation domain-containing protein